MKNLKSLLYVVCILCCHNLINAQKSEKRSPIYDYSELTLNNTDTIPDFDLKPNKLKITGTIFEKDGKTPAKDVILYICQPDEDGNYELKKDSNRNRYIHHRAWIKTDADGRYTFYTFMPGKNRYVKELKQIQRIIKVPGQPEQEINAFFFNDDPLIADLTLECRAQVVQSILKLEKQGNMFFATRDIKLDKKIPNIQ
jgi:protocatechuate 3,4-dioxygenase beta subunit